LPEGEPEKGGRERTIGYWLAFLLGKLPLGRARLGANHQKRRIGGGRGEEALMGPWGQFSKKPPEEGQI